MPAKTVADVVNAPADAPVEAEETQAEETLAEEGQCKAKGRRGRPKGPEGRNVSAKIPFDAYDKLEDHRWTVRKNMTEMVAECVDYYIKNVIDK